MNNIASLLRQHLETPHKGLYRQFTAGEWRDFTVQEVADLAARWQQAFRDQGFEKGDRIALCLRNSVNWVAIDQAALGLGLVVVPLYVDDNADNVAYCVANSEARLLVLENTRLLNGLQAAAEELPQVVILQEDAPAPAVSASQWLPAGGAPFQVIDQEPNSLATLVYTSGTTGKPKGVKLSHRNILANVEGALTVVSLHSDDLLLSLLPLSHMFERTCGYYVPLAAGVRVAYSRSINQLAEDLATHRPTVMISVPRVFERFLGRLDQALAKSAMKRQMFHAAVNLGWRIFEGRASAAERMLHAGLSRLVAAPIMAKLGGRLRLTVVGGAPLEKRVAHTFIGLGLNMIQGYGMTETAPIISGNREDDNDPASVGRPLPGWEIRISAEHELLVRGPSVMMGYWRNPEATRAVLDEDGWLNTGDQVEIKDGRLYIRGRTKDILVLSNGEKVPPQDMEASILNDTMFEQVMLVGEGKAFLALLAVTKEADEKKLVKHANAQLKDFPKYARVRRVLTFNEPWTLEDGLLTPTLKVKRNVVLERFRERIEGVYASSKT